MAGNNKFLKEFNETIILDLIRVHKAISKAELSQITGLSPTAIGAISAGLLEKGYIHETGIGESRGGRRPVLLELKPGAFFTVGVDLDINYLNVVLMDISGDIVHESSSKMPDLPAFQSVLAKIEQQIENVMAQFSIGAEKLYGVGISIPGMVNNDAREIILAPNLGWENIRVSEYLKSLSKVKLYVENEAMSSAICENWIGSCQGLDNFVCINVRSGIGAGIFTGGKLYRGASGSAGEVGHIMVDENGPKCGCGNYGCLETLASSSRIVEKAQKLVRQGVVSSLNEIDDIEQMDIDFVVMAARSGDEAAKGIFSEAARYMGIAVSNIVNTLNPAKIVLGKEFVRYADLMLEQINSVVACKALKSPASKVEIMASEIGEKASAYGAAIIPLKVLFGK